MPYGWSHLEVNASIPVKDVMTRPVVTVFEDDTIDNVAKFIAGHNIGSIVVVNQERYPVGVITERDIAIRIVAKNLRPSNVKAKEAMSSPLRTIDANTDIREAAKRMQRHGIRRLVVMNKGKMVGIVSSRDIVEVTPTLIEILMEKARITPSTPLIKELFSTGYCDRCRQWSDTLMNVDGRFICEECRIELN
jgi:CBS domain-containing protein